MYCDSCGKRMKECEVEIGDNCYCEDCGGYLEQKAIDDDVDFRKNLAEEEDED